MVLDVIFIFKQHALLSSKYLLCVPVNIVL